MHDTAVFLLTHQWTESVAYRFARLWREVSPRADCFVLLHDDQGEVTQRWRAFLKSMDAEHALSLFRPEALAGELGFALYGSEGVLGNTHLPLASAMLRGPWRHCWQIESDVEYRGAWSEFLQAFDASKADLLASHPFRFHDWPSWRWWTSLSVPVGKALDKRAMVKAFLPVFRISRPLLDAVLQAHREGWSGHFEVLMPTVAAVRGLVVEDLRSSHASYVGDSQDPLPILPLLSTMRWRPEISLREFTGRARGALLFHPVKQNWAFDADGVRRWPEPAQRPPS
ncbi:hypothetical protein [Caenimonas koreensis]|uniref:Core-2/I-Branching enzyme n=1 Tax=Caenimonas koreensis DSM 17982 TaxID=1121255 RepID=A0A844B737_9BURK|nr:hypothetical protein [Caenimonas koreensis]MRD47327.1 hypothetical protein [Caenimonas koreensis DSM 17982]